MRSWAAARGTNTELRNCGKHSLRGSSPTGSPKADTDFMSTALWIIVAVIAVATVAGGLARMRAWLQKPVPPHVIEAARRDDEEER